jgi:pimeloyl-ACP methyl ester carboxylesterase
LDTHRRKLCRILWAQWSPDWQFDDATFERTAASFDNPDFVYVVIHAYRFAFGAAEGERRLVSFEARLAGRPQITVPTVTLDGTLDPLKPGGTASHAARFSARHEHRVVRCVHNLPWKAPEDFADAILTVRNWTD